MRAAAVPATLFLVRHAPHLWQGRRLVGRAPGVSLAPGADLFLDFLHDRFARERVDAVHASPLERAQATAAPIASATRCPVETVEALTEVDFGAWTGRDVDDLADDPDWTRWCTDKARARAPGGESLPQIQTRMVAHAAAVCARHAGGRAVLVSHGDPLRALVAHVLDLPVARLDHLELDPGSVSAVHLGGGARSLLFLNEGPRP